MKCKKITIDIEDDDGTVIQHAIDLTKEAVLAASLTTDFNVKNNSEILTLSVERITPRSRTYAQNIKNPFWSYK